MPNLIATIIPLAGEQLLICTQTGRLFFSPDNGKTQTLERNSEVPLM